MQCAFVLHDVLIPFRPCDGRGIIVLISYNLVINSGNRIQIFNTTKIKVYLNQYTFLHCTSISIVS